jgi:predicted dehydrogenase
VTANHALVVGLGSIGTRHARILAELGLDVATVSRRGSGDHTTIRDALAAKRPGYAVIATETSQHAQSLRELSDAGFRGTVLVEKPLFSKGGVKPDYPFAKTVVGYNLRFHPVMTALAARVRGQKAITVSAYVGQDIRDWRPGRDHRATASSSVAAGGGVLRDLSHELDYLLWLFGPWRRVAALGGSSGARQLEVDDHIELLVEMDQAPAVQVHMDYLDRPGVRRIRINLADETLDADFANGRLSVNGEGRDYPSERDQSYKAMHKAAMAGESPVCSLSDGLAVVDLIDATENGLRSRAWVSA